MSCTNAAIISIKNTVLKYTIFSGSRTNAYTKEVSKAEKTITKITAIPIEKAAFVFLDTPKNGHNPKNLERIKLLIKTMLMAIYIILVISIFLSLPLGYAD